MPEENSAASGILDLTVPEEMNGRRLDQALAQLMPDLSRTRIQTLIREGRVSIQGKRCTVCREPVRIGDGIRVDVPPEQPVCKAVAEHIPLDVLYEDDDILVINKSPGMVVHPAAGNWTGTVVNALLDHDPEISDEDQMDPLRPGIVHRLDKDTSGALIIARTSSALRRLCKAFADHEVRKTYLAIVHGWPVPQASVIRTYIGRHPTDRKRMAVHPDDRRGAREAVSAYRVVRQGYWNKAKVAIVEVKLHTGRTYQIRVHMSHIRYPIAGDKLYGCGRTSPAPRQMLHAWKLAFSHPVTGKPLQFEAPFPEDFRKILSEIRDTPD